MYLETDVNTFINSIGCLGIKGSIRPYPFLPSTNQFINQRLHVHVYFIPWVFRNYQQHEYVLSLKAYAEGEIDGDNKHMPTCVRGNSHSLGIEPIGG
jgi:hypothetical protein